MSNDGKLSLSSTIILIATVASIAALVRAHGLASHSGMIDFYQFWLVGQFVNREGFEQIYSDSVAERIGASGMELAQRSGSRRMWVAAQTNAEIYPHKIEPISTPVLYAAFSLFSSGDFERDASRYQLFCTLSFAAGLVVLAKALWMSWPATAVALAVVLWFFPWLHIDIIDGNVARIQFAALALSVGSIALLPGVWGRIVGGFILAMLILFKPNLALAPIFLLAGYALGRQWKATGSFALGLIAGAIAIVMGTTIYLGRFELWRSWLSTISASSASHSSVYSLENQNLSLARELGEVLHVNVSWMLLLLVTTVVILPLVRSRRPGPPNASRESYAVATGAMAMLIFSPIVWPSYFMFHLPSILYLSRDLPRRGWPVWRWATGAGAFAITVAATTLWHTIGLRTTVYLFGIVSVVLLVAAAWDQWRVVSADDAVSQPGVPDEA